MSDRKTTSVRPSAWTVALLGVVTCFAVVAVRFALRQSVWTDESTQLSGLTLGFIDQLKWLAGWMPHVFSVPVDRMPPLSYWLGDTWGQVFGNGVLAARYLSTFLSIATIFALWAAARAYLPTLPALICVALLAFSPNFVVEAAEIRAYAAYILFSTLLIFGYLRLLAAKPTPLRSDLWLFALAAALCSFTHFFGIVIAAGACISLLMLYLPASSKDEGLKTLRKAAWPLLFYLVSVASLIPFVLSAVRVSGGGDVSTAAMALPLGTKIHDFIRLVYRFFSHQSMLGIPGLSFAASTAGVTLAICAAIPSANPRARELLLFFLVTLVMVTLAGLSTSAFHAFSPSYNVWVLPVTALLGGTACVHKIRAVRIVGMICVSVLLAADCYAAVRLATAGELYGHSRSVVI